MIREYLASVVNVCHLLSVLGVSNHIQPCSEVWCKFKVHLRIRNIATWPLQLHTISDTLLWVFLHLLCIVVKELQM